MILRKDNTKNKQTNKPTSGKIKEGKRREGK